MFQKQAVKNLEEYVSTLTERIEKIERTIREISKSIPSGYCEFSVSKDMEWGYVVITKAKEHASFDSIYFDNPNGPLKKAFEELPKDNEISKISKDNRTKIIFRYKRR